MYAQDYTNPPTVESLHIAIDAIPEPASLSFLALAAIPLLARRRR